MDNPSCQEMLERCYAAGVEENSPEIGSCLDFLLEAVDEADPVEVDKLFAQADVARISDSVTCGLLMSTLHAASKFPERENFYTRVRAHFLNHMPVQEVEDTLRNLIGKDSERRASEATRVLELLTGSKLHL